jgi:molecular chaperone GrpE (heat shock protein)/DNA-binding Xre family transcriptional regulator
MTNAFPADYSQQLRSLMQTVGISSFKALSRAAGVSEWQVQQLRQGKATKMSVESLYHLSQALHISFVELVLAFTPLPIETIENTENTDKANLQQEYERLQTQLAHQRSLLQQEFQQNSLQILESLLLQLPTASYAAQQNPQLPAVRLLPLLQPIERLLKSWGIEAIAAVGDEVPYDPHLHQLLDGVAQPGDRVKVRYTGYHQGDKLLYRAKVSPTQ